MLLLRLMGPVFFFKIYHHIYLLGRTNIESLNLLIWSYWMSNVDSAGMFFNRMSQWTLFWFVLFMDILILFVFFHPTLILIFSLLVSIGLWRLNLGFNLWCFTYDGWLNSIVYFTSPVIIVIFLVHFRPWNHFFYFILTETKIEFFGISILSLLTNILNNCLFGRLRARWSVHLLKKLI